VTNTEIDAVVAERERARQMKDYALADRLKQQLLAIREGTVIPYRIALLDEPSGTFWYWTTQGR
jgi:cysteinyl-tRNA synthetase